MIKAMNDLPTPVISGNNQISDDPISQTSNGMGSKEVEKTVSGRVEMPLKDVSPVEVELSHEVAQAGVKVQPVHIQLPQNVIQAGVQTVGGQTLTTGQAVVLPLTDEQIAKGLHASVVTSLRWLTEWCLRKLKQLHRKL